MTRQTLDFEYLPSFDGHEMVISIHDRPTGLRAFVAIHSTVLGPAVGGTRWEHYTSLDHAASDALALSKSMTYKNALAGLDFGGGKAVIMADVAKKAAQLQAFAQRIESLGGLLRTGTDMGLTDNDVERMSQHTRYMIGLAHISEPGLPTTSQMAALGVLYAIEASLDERFSSRDVLDRRIAIKGLGKLGGYLAGLLAERGARLLVADIDSKKISALKAQYPDKPITIVDPKDIHRVEADVLAPCAAGGDIHVGMIKELGSAIVAGGANNQLASPEVGTALHRAGVLYAPDYVANAGGLIHVTSELLPGGYSRVYVEQKIAAIADTLQDIYARSRKLGEPTAMAADSVAEDRLKRKALQ